MEGEKECEGAREGEDGRGVGENEREESKGGRVEEGLVKGQVGAGRTEDEVDGEEVL